MQQFSEFVESFDQLPTLPPVALRLIEAAKAESLGFERLCKIIDSDLAATTQLLRLANSGQFGEPRRVFSVERAVALLGLKLARNVALSVTVAQEDQQGQKETFDLEGFWHHSIACAVAAQILARRLNYPDPREAFLAGLLHDLGKVVLQQWQPEEYARTVAYALENRISLLEVEEQRLGVGHTEAGRRLMERWRFPQELIRACWLHHQPLHELETTAGRPSLPFLVKCADNLCHIQSLGSSGNPLPELNTEEISRITSLSLSELEDVSARTTQIVGEILDGYDWRMESSASYFAVVRKSNQQLLRLGIELEEISRRQRLADSIQGLKKRIAPPASTAEALSEALHCLTQLLAPAQVMAFALLENSQSVQYCFSSGDEVQRLWVASRNPWPQHFNQLNFSDQTSLIQENLSDLQGEVAAQLRDFLSRPGLLALPLQGRERRLGQILIHFEGHGDLGKESSDLLECFGGETGRLIEELEMFELVNHQAEEIARLARTTDQRTRQWHLEERLSSVGRLASNAAHQINNPLTVILGQAQLLLGEHSDQHMDHSALQTIIWQAEKISKITGNMVTAYRASEPRLQEMELAPLIGNCLDFLADRIRASGVQVETDLASAATQFQADPDQLEQVFLQLCLNALQAMGKGGTLRIRAGMESDPPGLRVEVSDTGPGISPAHLPFIFEAFYTTRSDKEGAGLGLYVARDIVESHGGGLSVVSRPGQGSTFKVTLPLSGRTQIETEAAVVSSDETAGAADKLPALPSNGGSRGHVLLVDDEEAVQVVVSKFLSAQGYQIEIANNGSEGLGKLEQQHFDVILSDLRMPHTGGLEFLAELKKRSSEVPVIIMSGSADGDDYLQAQASGAFAYLRKPFSLREVLALIQQAIGERLGRPVEA